MEEFTTEQQAHIDSLLATAKTDWETSTLSAVIAERDELLQFKPKDETDEQKQIKQLQADLLQSKVVAALQQADLEDFENLVHVNTIDDLQGEIDKLTSVLDARKLNNSFEPNDKRSTSAYDHSAGKKDAVGMIGAKFAKLFN